MGKNKNLFIQSKTVLKEKMSESIASVLPITIIVMILCFSISPIDNGTFMAFVVGAVMLILGMGFFTLGAEVAMTPIGERVGAHLTKSKNIWLIIIVSLIIGISITISEPDLQVLAAQVPTIPKSTLIGAISIGVGVFLVIAMLRIIFAIRLSYLLIGFYIALFIFANFVPDSFVAIAFDSGGVTTGPMTVPFIMALGVGVSSIRSDKQASSDSFGLVALCSVGPIIAVLILGMIFNTDGATYSPVTIPEIGTTSELWQLFASSLPLYLKEVGLALAPIIIFFLLFQVFALHLSKRSLIKIVIGLCYTYIGLVLFLTGANVGFAPAGNYIGQILSQIDYTWIIVPIGMLIGFFIVQAEPAVHVLNKQVEDITSGAIGSSAMNMSLSIGVAISVGLAMIRAITGISIFWFLIPGYAIALALTFFVPQIFTSIAFDSGGVASGPMTATFLLPFAMGVCEGVGGNVITDAFGVIAMVAMTPLITIQILGLVYKIKARKTEAADFDQVTIDDEIVEL